MISFKRLYKKFKVEKGDEISSKVLSIDLGNETVLGTICWTDKMGIVKYDSLADVRVYVEIELETRTGTIKQWQRI